MRGEAAMARAAVVTSGSQVTWLFAGGSMRWEGNR
jgi:hypothetical protein